MRLIWFWSTWLHSVGKADHDGEKAHEHHREHLGRQPKAQIDDEDGGQHDDRHRLADHQQRVNGRLKGTAGVHQHGQQNARRRRDEQADQCLSHRDNTVRKQRLTFLKQRSQHTAGRRQHIKRAYRSGERPAPTVPPATPSMPPEAQSDLSLRAFPSFRLGICGLQKKSFSQKSLEKSSPV